MQARGCSPDALIAPRLRRRSGRHAPVLASVGALLREGDRQAVPGKRAAHLRPESDLARRIARPGPERAALLLLLAATYAPR